MVDATDLKSVVRNGRASSSLATPIQKLKLFSYAQIIMRKQVVDLNTLSLLPAFPLLIPLAEPLRQEKLRLFTEPSFER
jgi:hypothetical protein